MTAGTGSGPVNDPGSPVGGQATTSSTSSAFRPVSTAVVYTPNPNPRPCSLGGESVKVVNLYEEVTYVGVWWEISGSCDPNNKAKISKGEHNRMEVSFEDDIAGFTVSLIVRDVGDVRVTAGGVMQAISILNTESWFDVREMTTCPVTYMFQFEPGTTGNTAVIEYTKASSGTLNDDEWMVNQIV